MIGICLCIPRGPALFSYCKSFPRGFSFVSASERLSLLDMFGNLLIADGTVGIIVFPPAE
jgi:hypothetical protein